MEESSISWRLAFGTTRRSLADVISIIIVIESLRSFRRPILYQWCKKEEGEEDDEEQRGMFSDINTR